MERSFSANDYVGGFGKYDVNLTYDESGGEHVVRYEYLYPATGKKVQRGSMIESEFRKYFGDALGRLPR